MPRGIGPAQQRILDALTATEWAWMTTAELGQASGLSERRVRQATDGLAARGLIVIVRGQVDWKGIGEYGAWRFAGRDDAERERATVIPPREELPFRTKWHNGGAWTYGVPTLVIQRGMPVFGRQHWLADRHAEYERTLSKRSKAFVAMLKGE